MAGSIPLFQNRYRSVTKNSEYLPISIHSGPFFFLISVEFIYLSMCRLSHHSFVFYTQSIKYRQLYCKEKQQMNEYIIIIYDKKSVIN